MVEDSEDIREFRQSVWNRILDMFERSVIIQAMLTLTLVVTDCVLVITNQEIPPLIQQLTVLVIGYYFGQKNVNEVKTTSQELIKAATDAVRGS